MDFGGMFTKIGNGFLDILEGGNGFLKDISEASAQGFRGEGDAALETIFTGIQENLMGNVMGGLFGPDGIGGGIVGAFPTFVRDPARDYIVDPVFGAWDWTIQELVDRPLGTYITVMQAGQRSGGSSFFDLSRYQRAWEINDSRTFGQAMAVGLYGIDPFDENEYNSIKDDPLFNLYSGTWDFAQEFVDPASWVGAGALKTARGAAVIGRPGAGLGRRFASTSRHGLQFLPRTGELVPSRVFARGAGIPGMPGTAKQIEVRRQIANEWTQVRADSVLNSNEWNRIENHIAAHNVVDPNQRFAVIVRGLGRRGAKTMPTETIRAIANGKTRTARERTFRALMGDNRIWADVFKDAREYHARLKTGIAKEALEKRKMASQTDEYGNPYPVDFSANDLKALDGLDRVANDTDWALFAAIEDNMYLSQQRRVSYNPDDGLLKLDSNVAQTLNQLPVDVQLAALDTLLGLADNNIQNANVMGADYWRSAVKAAPMGGRIHELLAQRRKYLETENYFAGEWTNPITIGGRSSKIRWLSEKVSHTHIFFKSSNAVEQFQRMLTTAGRLNVGGDTWADGAEINRRIGEFQGILMKGNDQAYAMAADYFKGTVDEINKWVDDHVTYTDEVTGERSTVLATDIDTPVDVNLRTMTDHYNANQTKWVEQRNLVVSVMDSDVLAVPRRDPQGSTAIMKVNDDNATLFIDYGMSPDQVKASSIIPRYDIVQNHLDEAAKRNEGLLRQKGKDVARRVTHKVSMPASVGMAAWRKSVLLTPKWPMRVGLDEQMRLMANIGTLNTLAKFGPAFKRMREAQAVHNVENFDLLAHADLIAEQLVRRLRERDGIDAREPYSQKLTADEYGERKAREQKERNARIKAAQAAKEENLSKIHSAKTDEDIAVIVEEQQKVIADTILRYNDLPDAKERMNAAAAATVAADNWLTLKRQHEELQAEGYLEGSLGRRNRESHVQYRNRIEREVAQGQKKRRVDEAAAYRAATGEGPTAARRSRRSSRRASKEELKETEGIFFEKDDDRFNDFLKDMGAPSNARIFNTSVVPTEALSGTPFNSVTGVAEVPGVGGEVILDVTQGKWQVPRAFRVGQPHPEHAAKHAELTKRLELREQSRLTPTKKPSKRLDLPREWRRRTSRERRESGLDWSQEALERVWESLSPEQQNRFIQESQSKWTKARLRDDKVPMATPAQEGADPSGRRFPKEVDKELVELRNQIAELEITQEQSVELYRQWVMESNEPMLADGPSEYVPASNGDAVDWTPEDIERGTIWLDPQDVRYALDEGQIHGKTLAVPGGAIDFETNKAIPNHATVLKDLSDTWYNPPTVFLLVTGSPRFKNRKIVWDYLDNLVGKIVNSGRHVQIDVRASRAGSDPKKILDGADFQAYMWARDRGISVNIRAHPVVDARFYEGMDVGQISKEDYAKGLGTEAEREARKAYDQANSAQFGAAARAADYQALNATDQTVVFRVGDDAKDDHIDWLMRQERQEFAADRPERHMEMHPSEVAEDLGEDPIIFGSSKGRLEKEAAALRAQSEETKANTAMQAEVDAATSALNDDAFSVNENNVLYRDPIGDEIAQTIEARIRDEYGEGLPPEQYRDLYNQYSQEMNPVSEAPIDLDAYRVDRDMPAMPRPPSPDAISIEMRDALREEGFISDVRSGETAESVAAVEEILNKPDYDFVGLVDELGMDVFEEVVDDLIKKMVLDKRRKKEMARAAGKSVLAAGFVFGNPVLGASFGYMSYMSKRRKIRSAGQRKAAAGYATALRRQGKELLKNAIDDADRRVARALMSDADYLVKLINNEIENAGKISSAFDHADVLMAKAGIPSLQIGNMAFRNGLGDDNRFVEAIGREVSANSSMSAVWSGAYSRQKRELENFQKPDWTRTNYGEVQVPADPSKLDVSEFEEKYARVVNLYTSNGNSSELQDLLWSNESIKTREDAVYKLLADDPEILRSVLKDTHKPDEWLSMGAEELKLIAKNMVQEYENVLPSQFFTELRQKARVGQFSWRDVEARIDELIDQGVIDVGNVQHFQHRRVQAVKAIQKGTANPLIDSRPGFGVAYGPDQATSGVMKRMDDTFQSLFTKLGTIPSDELARHPMFASVYERELRRLIEPMLDKDGYVSLSQKQIDRLENNARVEALRETKRVLYDLAETTRAGEVLANLSPFFNAWQEVLSRWAGFAVDNPAFVMNVARFYRKPWDAEVLGLSEFEDDNGNKYVAFRLFGDSFDEEGNVTTIWDVLPETVKDNIVPLPLQNTNSTIRFSKNGLNTMLQATPGAGPLVTMPIREAVLANPSLEDTFAFMFPFGHPNSSSFFERALVTNLPSYQQAAVDLLIGSTHRNDAMNARMVQDVVLEMSSRGDVVDYGSEAFWNEVQTEADRRTNAFFMFRIAAGLFSPTSTTLQSPYEPYKQAYNDLERDHGWRIAQTLFLDRYGEEFFAATATFGRSNDGVAASAEAEALYIQHQQLVQAHPSVGSWITGGDGSVAEQYHSFSQAAYQRQMTTPLAPGSSETRRSLKTGREAVEDTLIQLGWRKYTEGRDILRNYQDAALSAGMSSNLNSKHMNAVREWWSDYKTNLAIDNPVWGAQFNDVNGANDRLNAQLTGFLAGLKDDAIFNRPSSAHLREYLATRQIVQNHLVAAKAMGGSDDLEADSNAALLSYWEDFKYSMSVRPEFSSMYDRYFERDLIHRNTFFSPGQIPQGWLL